MSDYKYSRQADYDRVYKAKHDAQFFLPYNPETGVRTLPTLLDLGIKDHHDFRMKYFSKDFSLPAPHQIEWDKVIKRAKQELINSFRGGGKSVFYSRSYPLYYLLEDLNRAVLLITETDTLAMGYTSSLVEVILKNPIINEDFKTAALLDRTQSPKGFSRHTFDFKRFHARKENSFRAHGIGTKIIGMHPDLIILDDIVQEGKTKMKQESIEEWFDTIILPMRQPHTIILMIGTRKSPDDIYQYVSDKGTFNLCVQKVITGEIPTHTILRENPDYARQITGVKYLDPYWESKHNQRQILLWPHRWTLDDLLIIREEMEPERFSGEMMNEPVVSSGIEFKREWLTYHNLKDMIDNRFDYFRRMRIYIGVDIGGAQRRADYSVISSIGVIGNRIFLLKNHYGHWRIPKLLRLINSDFMQWSEYGNKPISVGIESNFLQRAIYDFLDEFSMLPIKAIKQHIKKEQRIGSLQTYFARQKVSVDPDSIGYDQFLTQYLNYPNVLRDDCLDAFEIAVNMAVSTRPAHLGIYRTHI